MNLHHIAKALGGEVRNGEILAPGPGHSPADRSLSIKPSSTAPDGFVVNSFASDDPIKCRDYVRAAAGIEPSKPKASERKTQTFDYKDPNTGKTLYRKTRNDYPDKPKSIYFAPAKRGGSPPLLYGGELLAKAAPGAIVWIVEGENKVEALRRLGAVAVSGDTGAESKWLPDHARLLRGRPIIFWPDSDDPGEKYIANAAAAIRADDPDADPRVVRPFPRAAKGEKGKDVCDWRGDAAALAALVEKAERYAYRPQGEQPGQRPKFVVEKFEDIRFEANEEWLVKRILPRQGVAAIYGKPSSYKSFVACNIAFSVALGREWAGRSTMQAPVVFIAAEAPAGFRKRIAGIKAQGDLPPNVPFHLISAAPNLGAENGDLEPLAASIEAAGVAPGLIVIDTLSQTLASADENGAGMVQFIANANALAQRFKALVLVVHHVGLSDDKRMRGHSSLGGAMDAVLLCERKEGELSAHLTLQKLKDEVSDICLAAQLSRVVIGHDKDGEDISTLVVEGVENAEPSAAKEARRNTPPSRRLLLEVVTQTLNEAGETFRPWADGPLVKAVLEDIVRDRYYERIAEQEDPAEDPTKRADRRRKKFVRAVDAMLDAKSLIATKKENRRVLWLPDADRTDGHSLKGGVRVRPGESPSRAGQNRKMSENVRVRPAGTKQEWPPQASGSFADDPEREEEF